jgi:hypothetical protein
MRYVLIIMLLAGCGPSSKQRADGITAFIESCAAPVSGEMALGGPWGDQITLRCTAFKPGAEATSAK